MSGEEDITGVGNQVVLDPEDRDKNDPSRLPGYSLAVTPVSTERWPGLAGGSGETRYDTGEMRAVAATLEGKRSALQDALAAIEALKPDFGPGSWTQATNLQRATDLMKTTMREYVRVADENLTNASAAVKASATRYDHAEDDTAQTVSNVASQVQSGTVGPTGSW